MLVGASLGGLLVAFLLSITTPQTNETSNPGNHRSNGISVNR
jgi:hypothetical protein